MPNQPPHSKYSSKYSNPLPLHLAILFLFYALSTTLCLSSLTTCVCVIFNPVGTFRTVATYLFYALCFSVLSTFAFVARVAVYFEEETLVAEEDHAASPEVVDVAPVHGVQYEVSAFQDTIHATPIREEEQREVSAAREIVPTTLTQEAHRGISTPQKVEETTHAASVSFQTALSDDPEALSIDTAQTSDGTPRFCDEMSASPEEMNDTVEQKENAPESNPTNDTKMNGQDEPTASAITARETEKIEKWISQTDLADTDTDADAANALLKGDDADDERSGEIENGAAIATWSGIDGGARSETRSVSPDSDFQTALRLYMVKGTRVGGRAQRRSGVNQRRTRREMFKLGKTGGERSARSA